jgi:hypothetical protein
MPLVPPAFPVNFRNWFPKISKKQIKDMFDAAGIPLGEPPDPPETGERRQLAMTYLGGIDWESLEDTEKVLKAISIALAMNAIMPADRDELRQVCLGAGLRIDGNTVALPKKGGPGIKNLVFASKGYKPEIVLIARSPTRSRSRSSQTRASSTTGLSAQTASCGLNSWRGGRRRGGRTRPVQRPRGLS